MRRRSAAVVSGLALAAAGLLTVTSPPGPAGADTPGCMTRHEFKRVHHGMPRWRVHRIFDSHGWFVGRAPGGFVRGYRSCNERHIAYITYQHGAPPRVALKRWTAA